MGIRSYLATALIIFLSVTAPAEAPAQGAGQGKAQIMDQRALDALKLMSDTIAQARTVRFYARSMVPIRTPGGKWINLYGDSRVVMQGPDKLFARTAGDFAPYDFYFDGKTITAYSPAKNLYAVKDAPPTIDEMIEGAYRSEGKSFPYADILLSEPYGVLTKGLTGAMYVGQSTIGGVKTRHLALSNRGVEWQIWIGVEDNLPRLVVATYLDDASEPSYTVEFLDWKLNEPVGAEAFVFDNASKAVKVEFRNPMSDRRAAAAPAAR
jgi:hypothetical protein